MHVIRLTLTLASSVALAFAVTACESEQERRDRLRAASFAEGRDSIMAQLGEAEVDSDFNAMLQIVEEWEGIDDDSLRAAWVRARALRQAVRDSTLRLEMLEKVKELPSTAVDANLSAYRELARIEPENELYRDKVAHYTELQQKAIRLAAMAKKWRYSATTDEMSGRTTRTAVIRSENTVNFDFPYQGAQRGTLTVRTHPSYGRDVIFQIEQGQILCNSYSRCRIRVRFDDGQATSWGGNPAADGSSTVVFLGSYNTFLSRMRRSTIVRIQPEIYQEGSPVFEFEVGGYDHSKYTGG